MSKPKAVFDSSGNLIVTLDKPYTFRQPKGRDLAIIQRSLTDDSLPIDIMVTILTALTVDGLTADSFWDLPADILVDLGGQVTNSFRVFSKQAV